MDVNSLPAVNATLNASSAVLLVLGWIFIKTGARKSHITCMVAALATSTLFLVCYVIYHASKAGVVTKFTAQGWPRPVYFTILVTHVILAFLTLPLVASTVVPAVRERFEVHKRVAKWTLPIWLYVSVTGVLVYLMLYKWFPPTL